MVKIVETTELSGGLTSFRTEIGTVDTGKTLDDRYEHYKRLLHADEQPLSSTTSGDGDHRRAAKEL